MAGSLWLSERHTENNRHDGHKENKVSELAMDGRENGSLTNKAMVKTVTDLCKYRKR